MEDTIIERMESAADRLQKALGGSVKVACECWRHDETNRKSVEFTLWSGSLSKSICHPDLDEAVKELLAESHPDRLLANAQRLETEAAVLRERAQRMEAA